MRYLLLFFCVVWGLGASPGWADDWMTAEPASFHSRGFQYVAEIFPPKTRQNPSDKPICYFYKMGYPGTDWKVDARLLWKAPLANERMPYQALVSMEGVLVTLNDWGSVGFKNAVTLYDKAGKLVRSYSLEELMPPEDLLKVDRSTSSRWWNRQAKYYFLEHPARFYVVLPEGKAMEFRLADGRFRHAPEKEFGELQPARKKPPLYANEETEIWETNLRFSSITDVVQAKRAK